MFLRRHELPPVRNPELMSGSLFGSHSLSACVAALFEIETPPVLFEEYGFEWFAHLDIWCHGRRFQVLNFTDAFAVRGWHLRFFLDPASDPLPWPDGTLQHKLEAVTMFGPHVKYNPSDLELQSENLNTSQLVFLPYDPAPNDVRFTQ